MKKVILLLVFLLGLTVSADSLPAEEEDFMPTKIKTVIQSLCDKEDTTFDPDASDDEDSVFEGWPSDAEIDIDSEEGILY